MTDEPKRVGGPVSRLRDVMTFAGGPLNGERDPFDLLDGDPPPHGTRRIEFEEGGSERCAEYEARGLVWHFLREIDAELGLGEGAYCRPCGAVLEAGVEHRCPPPPPPPPAPAPPPPPPPPPPV